ncbi:hypothetical protein ACFQS3_01440 [Glycomyces mayteni]|uniref:Uncharacterized protein n=1 Tax=Glycomyces mayteni TaxID=543887 RepID=A0ABW2D2W4_9ACTN
MNDEDGRSTGWHWHEYPVGVAGEAVRACVRSLLSFLIGLAAAFVLLMGAGILAEEHLLGDPGLESAVDDLSRMSAGLLLGLAMVASLAWAVATFLQEATTSRALVRAAERGASRQAVPSPDQVASVVNEPARTLRYFAWWNAGCVGGLGLIALLVVLADSDPDGWNVTWACLGYAALMGLVGYACRTWLPRVHRRRRALIAAHWKSGDETEAWKRAKSGGRRRGARLTFSKAEGFMHGGALLCVVGFAALTVSLGLRCGSAPRAGAECEQVHYAPPVEFVISGGFWIFAALLPVAALLAVAGVLIDWRQRGAERADLYAALDDPRSASPDKGLLEYHAGRRTHPLARVAGVASGVGLVFGTAAYLLGRGFGLGSQEFFALYRTESAAAVLVSAGLLVAATVGTGIAGARGRALRNALMERWPLLPHVPRDGNGKPKRRVRGLAV